MSQNGMDRACTIGIDASKNTLHLVGLDDRGTIVLREKLGRSRIRTRLANIPPCLIGIEATASVSNASSTCGARLYWHNDDYFFCLGGRPEKREYLLWVAVI
jgi:hypothetical protein